MKFTKTLLVTALMATSVAAQASFNSTNIAGGADALLVLVDSTNSSSYVLDLGVNQGSLSTLSTTPSLLGQTISAASDANLASFLGNEGASDVVKWSIVSGLSGAQGTLTGYYTLATTVAVGPSLTPTSLGSVLSYVESTIGRSVDAAAGANSAFASATTNTVDYVGGLAASIQSSLTAAKVDSALVTAAGTSLNLWESYQNGATTTAKLNLGGPLTFSITGTGVDAVATLAPLPAVAAVPLPTSVWMFLSGVVGLLSLNRRKNTAV
jgi:hypothetical protein